MDLASTMIVRLDPSLDHNSMIMIMHIRIVMIILQNKRKKRQRRNSYVISLHHDSSVVLDHTLIVATQLVSADLSVLERLHLHLHYVEHFVTNYRWVWLQMIFSLKKMPNS